MFVDASSLTAILAAEVDGGRFEQTMVAAPFAITSPIAVFETALALSRISQTTLAIAEADVINYLEAASVKIISITPDIGRLALAARARYGKGTGHPAKLNLGDCFAYACAKAHGVPLLYKGDDFVHTDLA